jgi:hypothetical protein
MAAIMVLYFYDDEHAEALRDTIEKHPDNIKEAGEFVTQGKVVAVTESRAEPWT